MPTFTIPHVSRSEPCWTGEAETLARAVESADLRGANLRGAYLSGAYLSGAYLSGAYLCGADLCGADLRGANLSVANLRRADLRGVDLSGALISWTSHDLISEILRRNAGASIRKRMIAGAVLVSRDFCWPDFLRSLQSRPKTKSWVISTLSGYVRDGDDAPKFLRKADADAADAAKKKS